MDPLNNPFSPGAGNPPPELAGRDDLLREANVTLARTAAGRYERSFILVGLRGVGKTVLLNRIRGMAQENGFGVVTIEATEARTLPELLVPPMRQLLFRLDPGASADDSVRRGLRVLRSFIGCFRVKINEVEFGLDIEPERGTADSGDLEADLSELFISLGEAAKDRNRAVAITVDEMQYLSEDEMSALIMAIHRISQTQLPIVLIGAGLPQLVGLAGRSKSYAERLFRYPTIGPLPPPEAAIALQSPVEAQGVRFEDGALSEIIRVTQGYPYFIQEWGYNTWIIAPASPIRPDDVRNATNATIRKLDESFFRVRFDRLTPKEKVYMRALADLGPGQQRSGDIADRLRVHVKSVAPLRSGLIKKGMIYSPAYGDTAFTVPLFDEFMRRIMPNWIPQ